MKSQLPPIEICLLTGGLSRRMGRDKSRLKLGRRTLLGHIRAEAQTLGLPVRVIRRDLVPRCGPLGGIFTALQTTRADAVLFLPCDMPFLRAALLKTLLRRFGKTKRALFTSVESVAGFPFVLRRETLATVSAQIERKEFSIQSLVRALGARKLRLPASFRGQLRNVNTPADWKRARLAWLRVAQRSRLFPCVEGSQMSKVKSQNRNSKRKAF